METIKETAYTEIKIGRKISPYYLKANHNWPRCMFSLRQMWKN